MAPKFLTFAEKHKVQIQEAQQTPVEIKNMCLSMHMYIYMP